MYRRWWLLPLALLLLAPVALLLDLPLARWKIEESWIRQIGGLLDVSESFGNGVGVGVILLAVAVLDPAARRYLGWCMAGAWGSGVLANVGKILIARSRPYDWLPIDDIEPIGVGETFVRLFPLGGVASRLQSFPSAHTATACGLACTLSALYPRGRWLFWSLAALVGAQRVSSDMHHVSDVLVGAALGCALGYWCASRIRSASNAAPGHLAGG